jgi:single-strand DNA-binding protein
MSDANITVVGNLTRDPELRFTPSGMATVRMGIAVNYRRRNQQTQEWDETTSFMNVVAFRDLAENAAESLGKGNRVLVTGRLEVSEYETKEGEKRQSVEIIADEIGPSLRWATASVARNDRRSPGDSNSGGGIRNGGNTGGQSGPIIHDEEPF